MSTEEGEGGRQEGGGGMLWGGGVDDGGISRASDNRWGKKTSDPKESPMMPFRGARLALDECE